MNAVDALALLVGFPAALLLSGWWLTARLPSLDAAGRLAAGLLAGLGMQLFVVSAVSCFRPLDRPWAAICLVPCVLPLVFPSNRARLWRDLREVARPGGNAPWVLGTAFGFLGLLFWPVFRDPALVFWDGTSNHDNFFWLVGAEYLKSHTCLEPFQRHSARPLWEATGVLAGLRPMFGRMGAEGLLAVASAALGRPVLAIYTLTTGALYFPWIAATYLTVRRFVSDHPGRWALVALAGLQPVFLFTQSNGNLPNLLGMLCAAALYVAIAHQLGERPAPAGDWGGGGLIVLSLHGLLCCYPEMLPFVLLPCGLLGLRALGQRRWLQVGWVVAALAIGAMINGVTTLRAYHGFLASFQTARADATWGNPFESLHPVQYLPAATTLMVAVCAWLGPWIGALLSLLLVGLVALTLARARDRFGLACAFAGAALLLGYTVTTHFSYGWQKTTQFAGVAVGALFPAGILAALTAPAPLALRPWLRRLLSTAVAVLLLFFAASTIVAAVRSWHWAQPGQKGIRREALSLRDSALPELNGGRVLVIPESFPRSFFHGMWAAYFLPRADLAFSPRARLGGGYLHEYVDRFDPQTAAPPDAVYVSRVWADSIDANSRRLVDGSIFAVLRESNLVLDLAGFNRSEGVPEAMATDATIVIRPHHASVLNLVLRPGDGQSAGSATIETTVTNSLSGELLAHERTDGPPPWRLAVPLRAGIGNRVEFRVTGANLSGVFPLGLESLRVTNQP